VAGDIINRGPRPLACWQLVQQRQQADGWLVLGGNHEEFVVKLAEENHPADDHQFEFYQPVYWTAQKMQTEIPALAALPDQQSLAAPDSSEVRFVHASMRGNRDGIYPETPDDVLRKQIVPPPPVFCVGHTHRPLIRQIDNTLVVNVGAVGLPFDGDACPSYARLTWQSNQWQATIPRIAYDLQLARQDFYDSGYVEEGGPLTRIMLYELMYARSLLYVWTVRYQRPVLEGRLSMTDAVDEYMATVA